MRPIKSAGFATLFRPPRPPPPNCQADGTQDGMVGKELSKAAKSTSSSVGIWSEIGGSVKHLSVLRHGGKAWN